MKLAAFLFIFMSTVAFSQETIHSIGSEKTPHLILQTRANLKARNYLFNQLNELLQTCCSDKPILENEIKLKQKEVLTLLAVKKINEDVQGTLKSSLFFDLGPKKEAPQVIKQSLNEEIDYSKNEEFLNRVALNIQLNHLKYQLDPSLITLSKLEASTKDDQIMLDLEAKASGLTIDGNDICISFSTFHKVTTGNDWRIEKKESQYQCDKKEVLDQAINQFVDNLITKKKRDKNAYIQKDDHLEQMNYMRDIGVHIQNISAKIKKLTPFKINLTFALSMNGSEIGIKLTQGSLKRLLSEAKSHDINSHIDLNFKSDQVAQIYGLPGFIIQDTPLFFTDETMNQALLNRKDELIALLVDPIVKDMEKITQKIQGQKALAIQGKLPKIPGGDFYYQASYLSFLNQAQDLSQISAGIDFSFPGPVLETTETTIPSLDTVIDDLHQTIADEKADIIMSLGEHFINDALQFALMQVQDKINESAFIVHDLQFRIDHLPQEIMSLEANNTPTYSSFLQGCVEVVPKKKFPKFLMKLVLGNKVQLPLIAYINIKMEISDQGNPTLYFDIPYIENHKDFLRQGLQDCQISKRLKKLAAKSVHKKIDKSYNSLSEFPLVKMELAFMKKMPKDLIKIELNPDTKRMNLLISLKETQSLSEDLIEKIELSKDKVKVSFPKLERLQATDQE